ncbi:MAG: DUF4080 domain-containing protein, partial [Monoglobales bacterium]
GLPYEDFESFKESFNFAYNIRPDELQLGFLKVLPGTVLHEKQKEYGIVADEFAPYEIIKNKWLSAEEIISLKNIEAVLDIYHNSGMLKYSEKPLLEKFETPFEMYQQLADFMSENGRLDFPHQKSDYLEFLFDFAKGYNLAEEITKDYFLFCRKKPSWTPEETELEKARINEILTEGKFDNCPNLLKVKASQRHKFAKFYKYYNKVFMVSYPDMSVQDITEIY